MEAAIAEVMSLFAWDTISFRDILFSYAFYYPLAMAWMWMIGGIWYFLRWENRYKKGVDFPPPPVDGYSPVSILIPCFNEEDNIRDTIRYALASEYPNFEVVAINDGSADNTGQILSELAMQHFNLRVVTLAANQGKAMALRAGATAARYEFLVCIDGDALIHPTAVSWIVHHLSSGNRVGAVTGNPRVINRSTLLGKLQVGEFSSTIGLMKRAQRVYGRIFTVSGVIAGYRRTALHRVGYWAENMVTEDIDISWRLQMDHWDIRFEPDALCYIYMPETFAGLWKQRLRWAQGGAEVLMKYSAQLLYWKNRRFFLVGVEYMASVIWAYSMFAIIILYFLGLVVPLQPAWQVDTLLPEWNGVILGLTAMLQFAVSLIIDRRYEPKKRFLRNYFWVIWYPLAFWLLSLLTTIVAVPKAILKRKNIRARWNSPDRGIRPTEELMS
ncbi:poly-beta-1,6-N-acetyl-D-glucosamine synthase [Sulfuriferula nivalis]|uniref:Poly-beta-1,6-N-acetyl-D-glucosamine synthase n=1 Tax=Sulfuriferula nivalis TaxID=2675298 RepID=A0A809RHM8_9PROT|nr:poly-beta-1,6-N-acetyl-D-glucosamine synthase [Sulfuriferula nivalis]BBP01399.1 poly-beta-1,6 N-acetyl-D-glucosamine synthase [Sulfuriferula nivalis]